MVQQQAVGYEEIIRYSIDDNGREKHVFSFDRPTDEA